MFWNRDKCPIAVSAPSCVGTVVPVRSVFASTSSRVSVAASPISVGSDPLRPAAASVSSVTSPLLHVTPYHESSQGSPLIQFGLVVHAPPAVPTYSAASADTAGQGVGPTKVPSATDQ